MNPAGRILLEKRRLENRLVDATTNRHQHQPASVTALLQPDKPVAADVPALAGTYEN